MKKKYKVYVDCANCAAKMEDAIAKIDGVTSATVNFLTQKLTLEADEEKLDAILAEAQKRCKKVDDDCVIYVD